MLFFLCVIFNLIFIFICRVWKPSLSGYWSETQLLSGTLPPSKRVKGYDQQEMWHIPHQDYCIRQFQCRDCCIWWFQHSKKENLSELKIIIFSGWDRINMRQMGCWHCLQPLKAPISRIEFSKLIPILILISNGEEAVWLSFQSTGLSIQRPRFKVLPCPLAEFVQASPKFKSSTTLVNSQLVCLRPVGILNPVN